MPWVIMPLQDEPRGDGEVVGAAVGLVRPARIQPARLQGEVEVLKLREF